MAAAAAAAAAPALKKKFARCAPRLKKKSSFWRFENFVFFLNFFDIFGRFLTFSDVFVSFEAFLELLGRSGRLVIRVVENTGTRQLHKTGSLPERS